MRLACRLQRLLVSPRLKLHFSQTVAGNRRVGVKLGHIEIIPTRRFSDSPTVDAIRRESGSAQRAWALA